MSALINKDDANWAIGSLIQTNVESGTYGGPPTLSEPCLVLIQNAYYRCLRHNSSHISLSTQVCPLVQRMLSHRRTVFSRSGLCNSRARSVLFIVTLVMFGISTAHVCLNSEYFIIRFPTLTSDSEEYNPPWLVARSARIALATMILRRTDVSLHYTSPWPRASSRKYSIFSVMLW